MFEDTVYTYIGMGLIWVAMLNLLAVPATILINVVVDLVWKFIDEGDSQIEKWLPKIFPFYYQKWEIEEHFDIGQSRHWLKDNKTKYFIYNVYKFNIWSIRKGEFIEVEDCFNVPPDTYFESKEEAKEVMSNIPKKYVQSFNLAKYANISLLLSLIGVWFIFLPTVMLMVVGFITGLYALRYSRRKYKKVKALKGKLDTCIKDLEAYKEG